MTARLASSALSAAAILLLATTPLQAAWKLESSRRVDSKDGVEHVVKKVSDGARSVTLHLAIFETPGHTLRVIDRPEGLRVKEAVAAANGVAGINGGFFHPDMSPAGMVVSDGKRVHGPEKAALLSGVVAVTASRLFVLRYGEFKLGPKTQNAIQAGPFLIDGGKSVRGLQNGRLARRSVILTDGGKHHALLLSEAVSLAEAGEILAASGVITEFRLKRALNLDGGSSSGFHFADGVDLPNFRPVRNCLVIAVQE